MPAAVPMPAAAAPAFCSAPGRPLHLQRPRLRRLFPPRRRETLSPRQPRHPGRHLWPPSPAVPLPAAVRVAARAPAPRWGRTRSALPPSRGTHTRPSSAARPTALFRVHILLLSHGGRNVQDQGETNDQKNQDRFSIHHIFSFTVFSIFIPSHHRSEHSLIIKNCKRPRQTNLVRRHRTCIAPRGASEW